MINSLFLALLAALTVWDYPARQPRHAYLARQFILATRDRDNDLRLETCLEGTKLLPDDPVWHYNYACSLALAGDKDQALEELERAIDCGFRNAAQIEADSDLKSLAKETRFRELLEYARDQAEKPLLTGPLAVTAATGNFGESVVIGEQNLLWDLDLGCFNAAIKLSGPSLGGNCGDLYVNRDGGHSVLAVKDFPGITSVKLDRDGRERGFGVDAPDTLYPYPVFGNASRAFEDQRTWRSLPRAMMTTLGGRMSEFHRYYFSNQFWVFPAHRDFPPKGEFGDVFASICPYWVVTVGSSWTDQYYLRAALEVSRSLPPATKDKLVKEGLLTPTVMTILRKSLKAVKNENDYLTAAAHPTAWPANALDLKRLKKIATGFAPALIPPVVRLVGVGGPKPADIPVWPELTYATPQAMAFVLRSTDTNRVFTIRADGASELAFRLVRDGGGAAKLRTLNPSVAEITIDRSTMTSTGRVDLAVCGREKGTGWGAPAYVSFAILDEHAPYCDPALLPPGTIKIEEFDGGNKANTKKKEKEK